jgi:hypothetical protein
LIVSGAPFLGGFFAVGLAASKRAINIVSAGIAGMSQKEYSALPTPLQAGPKMGMLSNNGTKLPKILSNYPSNDFFPIPGRLKLKKGLKSNDKKAKSSLVWLIMSDIPSFPFHFFRKLMIGRGYFFANEL